MRQKSLVLFFLGLGVVFPLSLTAQQAGATSTDARLSQAVEDQKLILDDSEKSLIVAKCQAAQKQLGVIHTKTDKVIRLRVDTYSAIQKELQAIKLRMARQGVDASVIDLLVGKLQQGLDELTLATDAYTTSLKDIITLDCTQKPEQFMAGLVITRAKQALLYERARALKQDVNEANSETFNQLKNRLKV